MEKALPKGEVPWYMPGDKVGECMVSLYAITLTDSDGPDSSNYSMSMYCRES